MRKYAAEWALGLTLLALGGWANFLVNWGQATERVETHNERLDKIDGRLDKMETDQQKVVKSLGRIEERLGIAGR